MLKVQRGGSRLLGCVAGCAEVIAGYLMRFVLRIIFPTMVEGKFTRWGLVHCRTMECLMNKRSSKTELFGTFIYGHIGDGPFSVHLDGSERHQKIPPELMLQL